MGDEVGCRDGIEDDAIGAGFKNRGDGTTGLGLRQGDARGMRQQETKDDGFRMAAEIHT